jgi:dTDP-glucose 4,6-dehydratase
MQDVSDATLRIMEQAPAGEIFHIATKDSITIRNLVEMICELMNVNFEDHVDVAEERLGKDSAYLLESTKIRNTLGWQDQVSLKDGISAVIDWIDKNFDTLKEQPIDYVHKA